MRKQVYLEELSRHIRKLPAHEVKDILADYEEHFQVGKAAGKTDEAIIDGLGQAKTVAHEILMNSLVSEAEDSTTIGQRAEVVVRMLILLLILAPFNFLIFIGPFLVLFCLAVSGWAIPLALFAVAFAVIALLFKSLSLIGALGLFSLLSLLCMWVGTLGAAVMIGIIMLVLTKGLLNLLIAYVKWNINFITARKA